MSRREGRHEALLPYHELRLIVALADDGKSLVWLDRPEKFFNSKNIPINLLVKKWRRQFAGKPALTCKSTGYYTGVINGKHFKAHRVIWCLHYGDWPHGIIDHINGNGLDNRIENLRCVDYKTNCTNRKIRSDNTTGYPGVYKNRDRWVARIGNKNIGNFKTLSEAIAARKEREIQENYIVR